MLSPWEGPRGPEEPDPTISWGLISQHRKRTLTMAPPGSFPFSAQTCSTGPQRLPEDGWFAHA